jgi:hypothetical protein
MAMDAGKFNFKNVGGVPPKTQKQTTGGPKESPSVQQDPSESVQIGAQPVADAKTDKVTTGDTVKAEAAPKATVSSAPSSIPTQVGDFLIAGVSGKSNLASFDGLTALNGLGSNSLQSLSGGVVASANPLNPKSATKVPTTSIGLMNGIEDTSWTTSSGRVISL